MICNVVSANRQLLLLSHRSKSLILFVKDTDIQCFDFLSKTCVNFNTWQQQFSSSLFDDRTLKIQRKCAERLASFVQHWDKYFELEAGLMRAAILYRVFLEKSDTS